MNLFDKISEKWNKRKELNYQKDLIEKRKKIDLYGQHLLDKRELEDLKKRYEIKKSMSKSDIIIIANVIAIISYTIVDIWLQKTTGMEISPTLTEHYFTFFNIDLVALAGIKISNIRNNNDINYKMKEYAASVDGEDESNEEEPLLYQDSNNPTDDDV